ncbi:hypothetical protein [Legionella fallonii]|uniref:Uncharacterized protein n=1 Tax=Legionella fallonii LLAP-10 TaxID=1212491 RepID=A0A098G7H3_9GAMM|nr:hypothetical protein [Legionella fallonii]CEG58408.1 conserved protein of unknown function [Legionella fallonii LLAP-10]
MVQLFIRFLFVISGAIASWFVARDALHFPIIQMVIAVLLFTFLILSIAFWPQIKNGLQYLSGKHKNRLKK